jgi:hypothetical protein
LSCVSVILDGWLCLDGVVLMHGDYVWLTFVILSYAAGEHALAYLVEALCYKPEGRGIESRWGRFFQLTYSFQPHYGPGVDSASNRNEYQESFWWQKAAGIHGWQPCRHLRVECLDQVWNPRRLTTLRAFTACYEDNFTFLLYAAVKMRSFNCVWYL